MRHCRIVAQQNLFDRYAVLTRCALDDEHFRWDLLRPRGKLAESRSVKFFWSVLEFAPTSSFSRPGTDGPRRTIAVCKNTFRREMLPIEFHRAFGMGRSETERSSAPSRGVLNLSTGSRLLIPLCRPYRHPGENGVHSHPLNLDTVFQRYDGRCPSPGCRPEFILSASKDRHDELSFRRGENGTPAPRHPRMHQIPGGCTAVVRLGATSVSNRFVPDSKNKTARRIFVITGGQFDKISCNAP